MATVTPAHKERPRPTPYVRPMPWSWWLKRPAYTKFMVRELTSAFIAAYAVFLVVLACAAKNVGGVHAMVVALRSPMSVVLHLIVLAFALFHTVTFFNLTPRALVFRIGEEKVPEEVIQLGHYAAWVALSLVLFFAAWLV